LEPKMLTGLDQAVGIVPVGPSYYGSLRDVD
jgi:hypothetical protein